MARVVRIEITETVCFDAVQAKVFRNDVRAMFRRFTTQHVAGAGGAAQRAFHPLPKHELRRLGAHLAPRPAGGLRLFSLVPRSPQRLLGNALRYATERAARLLAAVEAAAPAARDPRHAPAT